MKYKLLCIDIDGTLLDDNKKILPQTKSCLRAAYDQGIRIALASGRMPAGVDIIEKELGIECIKICNAGTYIFMGETCIGSQHMSNTVMKEVWQKITQTYNVPLWIFQERDWFVTGIDAYVEREMKIIPYRPKVVNAGILADKWDQEGKRPNKLLVAAKPDMIQAIYRKMEAQAWHEVDMARSADFFLEIFPRDVNKGTALDTICKKLDINPKETIAIGDQELDIPMIEAAGVGIAMGNAITQLKEKADFVTASNNESGIACALERYLIK